MSRNLGRTSCAQCGGSIRLCEKMRLFSKNDNQTYFSEYEGMIVAHAECSDCLAKYLAWLGIRDDDDGVIIKDLSYRNSFNDEPSIKDMPTWEIVLRAPVRTPWPECDTCGAPMSHKENGHCMQDFKHTAKTVTP